MLPFSRLQTQVHQEPPDFSNHPLFETCSPRKLQKTGGLRNWRDSSLVPKPNAWSVRPQESNALCHVCFPFQDFRPKCTRNRPISQTFQPPKIPKKGWFEKLAGFEPCTRWPSPMPGPLGHRSQMHCVMCASLFKATPFLKLSAPENSKKRVV